MTLVFTVDERMGLAFGKRRQSRDRELTRDLVAFAGERRIVASEYSRLLFEEAGIDIEASHISLCENPISEASGDDVVFLELACPKGATALADEIVLYLWNRHYPSTSVLDIRTIERDFILQGSFDFAGRSHEKLTRVVYKRL